MYEIIKTDYNSIKEMKYNYYKNLTAPMDDMWEEGIIPKGDFYIVNNETPCGYFAIDQDMSILVFHAEDKKHSHDIFRFVIEKMNIDKAYVSTYDPLFFNLCVNQKKTMSINTLLYTLKETNSVNAPLENIIIHRSRPSDLEKSLTYYSDKIGDSGDWLEPYLKNLISTGDLFLFLYENEIIGTGEGRYSKSSTNTVNIGMTVSKDYRRLGVASYIISYMNNLYISKNYNLICSTTLDNVASQRTLEKCGYQCYHKIYDVTF